MNQIDKEVDKEVDKDTDPRAGAEDGQSVSPEPEPMSPGQIVEYYQKHVKKGDTNRGARAAAELLDNGYTGQQLIASVDNYRAWKDFPARKYRKDVGNFFGADGTFEDYLVPVEAEPEEPYETIREKFNREQREKAEREAGGET